MYDIYDNDFDKAFDEAVEAIEKKEHRLIWADKLKRHYAWWQGGTLEKTLDEMKRDFDTIVDLQPTVQAEPKHDDGMVEHYAEMERHRKRGRWKGAGMGDYMCSLCAEVVSGNRWHYCPYCGAKMDGGENGRCD